MRVILKEGEFDKLPRPEDFGFKNILEYHNLDEYTIFDVHKCTSFADDDTNDKYLIIIYNDITIEMRAERFITVEELRDTKLNQLI